MKAARTVGDDLMSTGRDLSVAVTASATPTNITLHFAAPGSYRIWKKLPHETSWSMPIWERPLGTEFVDQKLIEPGIAWEYKAVEFNTGACSYILAGYNVPQPPRGKLVLLVERSHADTLSTELERFIADLEHDGYAVLRREVNRGDVPESVKATLKAAYLLDPDNTHTAILFGAVPVKLSGPINYDGHGDTLVAADGYFADMNGDWSSSPSIYPAPLRLALGRIDFSGLTCFSNKPVNPRSERDLLRQYLNRNHAWRTGQWSVPRRGAIRDGFPDRDFSRNAWANMSNLCREGIDEIADGQFFSALSARDYLLAFACGGGQITSMAGTGGTTSGSDDFALTNIRTPFLMLLGSALLGQWHRESNFLRSGLASGDDEKGCLAAFGAGAPHVFLHHMALGGSIGEALKLSRNNFKLYAPNNSVEPGLYTPSQSTFMPPCSGRVHQALMGDPTLGLYPRKDDSLRILELQSGPTPTGPWTSLGKVEVKATSPTEFYRLQAY